MSDEIRKKRLELNKSIEEISEITKIKKSYLIAIEEKKYDELPLEIYTRSYIKIFGEYVGADYKKVLEDYERYLNSKRGEKGNINIEKNKTISSIRDEEKIQKQNLQFPRWAFTALISAFAIILFIILTKIENREEVLPPIQQSIKIADTNREKIKTTELIKDNVDTGKNQLTNEHNLIIEATDKVWMRINIDEIEKKELLLNAGENVTLKAKRFFHIHLGNAGGVRVVFNGKDIGKLGNSGQVVYLKLPRE